MSRASKLHGHDIHDLIFKLQALLPHLTQTHASSVSASEVLKEACNYIRMLQREADDLSERLSQLLESMNISTHDMEFIRNILQL
ncbi:Transcription factor ILI5 [Euphorbia peplus]|nr:Transcription factor ILI5 [Euphorbia peplus]